MSSIPTSDQIDLLADRLEARSKDMELATSRDAQFAADLVIAAEILRDIAPLMQIVDEMQDKRQIRRLTGTDDQGGVTANDGHPPSKLAQPPRPGGVLP